jgi:hypothetical protein
MSILLWVLLFRGHENRVRFLVTWDVDVTQMAPWHLADRTGELAFSPSVTTKTANVSVYGILLACFR